MLSLGQSPKDISHSLGVTTAVVHYVNNSHIGKRELGLIQGARNGSAIEISNQIQELAPEALDTLERLMKDDEESPDTLRAKIAMDVLDRAGHGAVKKQVSLHQNLSKEDINNIKQRAKDIGEDIGLVVDAEIIET